MKRILAILVLTVVSSSLFAQHNKNIEDFINQVYTRIVPNYFEYYNLYDSSFVVEFDKYSLNGEDSAKLLKENPDFPIDFFTQESRISKKLNWADYNLQKARVYTEKLIPRFYSQIHINRLVPYATSKQVLDSLEKRKEYYETIVPIKSKWGKKRREKEIKKVRENYTNSVKSEDRTNFCFSTPLLSYDGKYAIVGLNESGRGFVSIFKNVEGKWVELFMFKGWVS